MDSLAFPTFLLETIRKQTALYKKNLYNFEEYHR